jgi:Na+-driven multidrug efflux pump
MYFLFIPYGINGIALGFSITETSLYMVYLIFNKKILKLEWATVLEIHKPFIFIFLAVGLPSIIINVICSQLNTGIIILFVLEIIIVPLIATLSILYFPSSELKSMARSFIPRTNEANFINDVIQRFIKKVAA